MDGIVNVLKPVGMTSADIVRWLVRKTKVSKAGHTGTLDPGAAGVLPVCLGKATRLADYYSGQGKYYRAEITLGISTDTQDAFGAEVSRAVPDVSRQEVGEVLNSFLGDTRQIPPMYSALKKNGRPLYELARRGLEVSREKRPVRISKISIVAWENGVFPKALLDIECGKGTYIRTLCQDIGDKLGCGAHMSFLLRLQSGKFSIENAYTLEEIEEYLAARDYGFLLNPEWGLGLPKLIIPSYRLASFRNGLSTDGKMIGAEEAEIPEESAPVQVFCENCFIGIGIYNKGILHPYKVLY